ALSFFLSRYAAPRPLPSFPTRRSSDLLDPVQTGHFDVADEHIAASLVQQRQRLGAITGQHHLVAGRLQDVALHGPRGERIVGDRSEEHTSELQSRSDLVCRLLLEKKKV